MAVIHHILISLFYLVLLMVNLLEDYVFRDDDKYESNVVLKFQKHPVSHVIRLKMWMNSFCMYGSVYLWIGQRKCSLHFCRCIV